MKSQSRTFRALALRRSSAFALSAANDRPMPLPSFARQTGQQCATCHAGGQFPELTAFGRMFKLTGYTIGTGHHSLVGDGEWQASPRAARRHEDAAFAKDAVALFQTGSVFLAGKITDKSGIFAQATYNNYDHRIR